MYKHTQKGTLMIMAMLFVITIFAFVFVQEGLNPVMIGVMIFILGTIYSFSSLTVEIDHEFLKIKSGYGLIKKKYSLKSIVSVKQEKHKWYMG